MSFRNKKQVLVTGSGGFVGSHLAEELVRKGADVLAMIRYNALAQWGWLNHSDLASQMGMCAGDIAALIAIPYSFRAPGSYVRTNIEGTVDVLQAARELNTPKVVHTSTSEVYGTARSVPISEALPFRGQSPYSAPKIFGRRQSARTVMPSIITRCLKDQTVKLGSLSSTREFNYVANKVSGFLKAGVSENSLGRTFNFGTSHEIGIGDVVRLISKLAGKPIDLQTEETRLRPCGSEVEPLLADATAAHEALGWPPDISLEEGLVRTISGIEQNQAKYRADVYNV